MPENSKVVPEAVERYLESTLDSVDTLLSLAFHAARSDGHRLVWSKDIERVVASEAFAVWIR